MTNKEQQDNKTGKANKQALHLIARDVDDLNFISALLQDAVLLAHDMVWDEKARIFALMVNRFHWETQKETQNARIRTGVHFHGVTNVENRGIKQHSQQVLSLLALQFEPHKTLTMPAGYIRFVFSAGAELLLTVEALNVIMQDVTESWPTAHRPKHE